MSFTFLNELPSPAEIKQNYPLSDKLKALKKERDAAISAVITGADSRFLVIIGPCSADNEDSVCDYVSRLTSIQEDVADKLILIPRVYTNKPRTTGEGYKGIASQPDPEKAPDMIEGLIAMRKMHIRAIEESGLTCADEMLYPENWGYVEDLLSYVAIGARSVEDQQHRLTVSGFDVASGMKNPTSGDFSVMLNSVYAAQHPHHFVYRGYEVETTGNPLTHVVLRGAVSKHGNTTQNYHYEDLIRLCISEFHPEYSENLIFEYSESKLYRIYRDCNGEICREQTLYAHFQQRKFLKISTCNLEHYLIVPNRIIDYQKVTIDNLKMWTRSQELKRRLYNLKNRINHRLNIIFK